jgi:hypothetical protein
MRFGESHFQCFRFAKMCLWLVNSCQYADLMVNVTYTDLDPLAFILNVLTSFILHVSLFADYVKQWLYHSPWLLLQYLVCIHH